MVGLSNLGSFSLNYFSLICIPGLSRAQNDSVEALTVERENIQKETLVELLLLGLVKGLLPIY